MFDESKRPKVGVGVFVIKDGKILMQQRINAHGEGTWSLPGGHLEFGEAFEDCARREVLEEMGVTITNVRQIAVTNDVFDQEEKHYITIFMVAELADGEPHIMEPDRTANLGWHTPDALPDPLFLPIRNLLAQGTLSFL